MKLSDSSALASLRLHSRKDSCSCLFKISTVVSRLQSGRRGTLSQSDVELRAADDDDDDDGANTVEIEALGARFTNVALALSTQDALGKLQRTRGRTCRKFLASQGRQVHQVVNVVLLKDRGPVYPGGPICESYRVLNAR